MSQEPACEWKEYKTEEGKVYYHNSKTNQSVWHLPQEVKDQMEKEKKEIERRDRKSSPVKEKSTRLKKVDDDEDESQQLSRQFRQFMKDKKIGLSTKWDEAQAVLNKEDDRWNLIHKISEKKKIFQEYMKELKDIKDEEDRNQRKAHKKDYFKLLEEQKFQSDVKFHKVQNQVSKDQRYRVIEEREREHLFQDFVDQLYKQEREDLKKKNKESQKKIYLKLKHLPDVNSAYSWHKCCDEFQHDTIWKEMHEYDRIVAFSDFINDLQREEDDLYQEKQQKEERSNRESFQKYLKEQIRAGKIHHKSKYKQFVQENQENKVFLKLLGQSGSSPHEYFLDEIFKLRDYHSDFKQELKDFFKNTKYEMNQNTQFSDFKENVVKSVDTFEKLQEEYQHYFYNIFMDKFTGKSKGKDLQKKEKKLKKIKKRFFKILKQINKDITPASQYNQLKEQIEKLISQNPKLEKIKPEMREKLFEEYVKELQSSKKDDDDDSDSEDREKDRKRKSSKQYDIETSKKVRASSPSPIEKQRSRIEDKLRQEDKDKEEGEMEEEGEINEEKDRRREKRSKKDKKRKRSRSGRKRSRSGR